MPQRGQWQVTVLVSNIGTKYTLLKLVPARTSLLGFLPLQLRSPSHRYAQGIIWLQSRYGRYRHSQSISPFSFIFTAIPFFSMTASPFASSSRSPWYPRMKDPWSWSMLEFHGIIGVHHKWITSAWSWYSRFSYLTAFFTSQRGRWDTTFPLPLPSQSNILSSSPSRVNLYHARWKMKDLKNWTSPHPLRYKFHLRYHWIISSEHPTSSPGSTYPLQLPITSRRPSWGKNSHPFIYPSPSQSGYIDIWCGRWCFERRYFNAEWWLRRLSFLTTFSSKKYGANLAIMFSPFWNTATKTHYDHLSFLEAFFLSFHCIWSATWSFPGLITLANLHMSGI